MLRPFYRCLLRLHPPAFRERFADEMLSIFDHSEGIPAGVRLLADGLLSLLRQWTLRPEFWHELSPAQQPAPDGIPSFYTLDPFRPCASAVVHGLVLSTAVFCLTGFAIRYSWIHILHVRIPEVQFDSPRSIQTNSGSVPSASLETPTVPTRSENSASRDFPTSPRSAVHVSEPVSPSPLAIQNRAAQNTAAQSPTAGHPQSQVRSDAPRALEAAGRPKRAPAPESAKPSHLQSNALLPLERPIMLEPQIQPTKAQETTSATVLAVAGEVKLNAADRQRVIHAAVANLTKFTSIPTLPRGWPMGYWHTKRAAMTTRRQMAKS